VNSHARIKLARRKIKLSQSGLADAIGVHRSAVSQWESPLGKNPTTRNLRKLAELTVVHFEWLATGRGSMSMSKDAALEDIPAAHMMLIEDSVEMRMVTAIRAVSAESRLSLVEIAEQLAAARLGRTRKRR
jgi:transcriptional regulator with XRE-family HTH domain